MAVQILADCWGGVYDCLCMFFVSMFFFFFDHMIGSGSCHMPRSIFKFKMLSFFLVFKGKVTLELITFCLLVFHLSKRV